MAGVLRQPLLMPAAALLSLFTAQAAGIRRAASFGGARGPLMRREALPHQQKRGYARPGRSAGRSQSAQMSPATEIAKQQNGARSPALISFRLPSTFVPPAMGQYLSKPRVLAKLLWYRVKSRFTDLMAETSMRLQSKPSLFKGARYKPNNKAVLATAKTMHYQMLEAIAAGDTGTLSRLLTQGHMDEVAGLLARRARGRRCKWELLSYKGRPKVVDSKVVLIPGQVSLVIRQVVVTIRSRQRFTWTDNGVANRANANANANSKPDSVVEKDVKENLVLVAFLDRSTWETSEWRIFGFMPETTLDNWEAETQLMKSATKNKVTIT